MVQKSLYYTIENPLISCSCLKIQKVWRGSRDRKRHAIFRKQIKYRAHIINEIVKSEETYIADLNILIENCYLPLKQQLKTGADDTLPVLQKSEFESLFANLVDIRNFNADFHTAMTKEFSTLSLYSEFSQVMISFSSGFKVYYPYTANYDHADKTLQTLREKNKKFGEYLQQLEYTPSLKNMDLSSLVIKPVQRLCKYPLLLADLLRSTPASHPDYAGIQHALDLFKVLNSENNLHMERYAQNMKMMELQELYSVKLKTIIYVPDRVVLSEEFLKTQLNEVVRVIIMTDMVLIINDGVKEVRHKLNDIAHTLHLSESLAKSSVSHLKLDVNSLVKDNPDLKYFANRFTISGVNAAETFIAETTDDKERIITILRDAILVLRTKALKVRLNELGVNVSEMEEEQLLQLAADLSENRKLEVHIIGSEERTDGYKPHTIYIVLLTCGFDRFHKCFKRHSEFCKLSKVLNEMFPLMNFPRIEKKIDLLKSNRTKTIEQRKMAMEDFLQRALQDPEVRNSQQIQDFIRFPKGFFDEEIEEGEASPSGEDSAAVVNRTKSHLIWTRPRKLEESTSALLSSSPAHMKRTISEFPVSAKIKRGFSDINSLSNSALLYSNDSTPLHNKSIANTNNPELRNRLLCVVPCEDEEYAEPDSAKSSTHVIVSSQITESRTATYSPIKSRPISGVDKTCLGYKGSISPLSSSSSSKYSVNIYLVEGTSFEFKIDNRTSARMLCEQIAQQMKLLKYDDFRLFVIEGNDLERALDGDECIIDVATVKKEMKTSFFARMKKSLVEVFKERTNKLVFKKYYYISKSREQSDFLSDNMRLTLLVSQILQEVKEMRYDFDYQNHLLMACLGAYNNYYDEIKCVDARRWLTHTKIKKVLEFIPDILLNTKPKDFWKMAVESYWSKLLEEIEMTMKKNQSFIEDTRYSDRHDLKDTLERYMSLSDAQILIKHLILNVMWSRRSYGVALYEARVYQPNEETISRQWPTGRFLLGVKYGELLAFSMNKSKCYVCHKLSEISDEKCFPTSLVLTFSDYKIRFDTKKSFAIMQMIHAYQIVEQSMHGLN